MILPDGRTLRLVYDGRNGQPYTSIGRKLIEAGEIAEADMSLARLKAWLRAHGLRPGERGRELMRLNKSYIYFRLEEVSDPAEGPTGGANLPLTALRSIAVDRTRWSYGLPFWIEAELPWRGGQRRAVPPADDCAGHRFGDRRRSPLRSVLRHGRRGGRARRRDPPSGSGLGARAEGGVAMKDAPPRPSRALFRKLSDEEIELWTEVARSVARRRGANLPTPSRPKPPEPKAANPSPAVAPGKAAAMAAKPGPLPLAPIERRLKRDLARGSAVIDDALDMHGLNQAEAHHALRHFLFAAQARGAKLVIVVTGKGKVGPAGHSWNDEPGVLRRLAPHWLKESDLRPVVLGFEEAGRTHGGSGALYVRIDGARGA